MKDQIIKFLAYNGKVSIVCANTTYLVETARNIHDLSPVATAALGRMLTAGALIGAGVGLTAKAIGDANKKADANRHFNRRLREAKRAAK